jgi:hypothetical protein
VCFKLLVQIVEKFARLGSVTTKSSLVRAEGFKNIPGG